MEKIPIIENIQFPDCDPENAIRSSSSATEAECPASVTERTFRSFIENLPVMFYAVSADLPHRPLYISPTFKRFGYPLEDWFTNPDIWDQVIHPDDRENVLTNTREAMRRGEDVDFEYRVVCKDGEILWVRDTSCFIKNENGEPICWQGIILDVTERKEDGVEIEKREKLYRTLAQSIPKTAVLLFNHDFRYTLADGEQLKHHGFTQEGLEGKTLWEAFPAEIAEEWAEYYKRALDGETITFETENADGAYQINVLPVHDENGVIFAGMVMWQDITERKQAVTALTESEARFRQLVENANDIIYVHDLDGNYTSINKAGERIFGYTHAEALQLNLRDVIAPEHLYLAMEKLTKKSAGSSAQTIYELDCVKKDGERVTLEVNSSLVEKHGTAVGVQGIARDITERKIAEEMSRKSDKRFQDLFENANDLIYTHDMKGNFTSLNRAGEEITGYSRDEALTMNIVQVVAPEFLAIAKKMTAEKLSGHFPTTYEIEIVAKNGNRIALELNTRLIVNDGSPVGVQGIGRDITARRQVEVSLRNALSLLASTFESTADGIVVMGLEREFVTCNQKFAAMWGVDDEILKNNDSKKLVACIADQLIEPESFLLGLDETYSNPDGTVTEMLHLKDGRIFERYSQPQFADGVPIGRVASFRDMTLRNKAEEKLRYFALHDPLTNLPNRAQFMNHLKTAVERTEGNSFAGFAVLFLDLDRFKVINDSLGHSVGDQLLVAISERLTSCVRPGDIVARLGGDEFTILLQRCGDMAEIVKVAERLQSKISRPFMLENYEVFTTASIGIVVSSDVMRTAEDFLRDADAAMYRAKESGKARYEIFDRDMHALNMNMLQLETDMRHAVERNEFEVLYQPIVSLDSGQVSEFEALLRWRHPVHGLVGPTEFVHVAEETGLIVSIGRWILEEACRQTMEWERKFKKQFSVSVNLSAKQLLHPNLTTHIKDALIDSGLSANQLKLEVTESTVMEHSDRSLKILSELDHIGIQLSTDDFGTGYSSLSYLQKFPFKRLKIDRSFIQSMDVDEKSGAIVKTILMLGENLNLDVVAEGIESVSQLDKLREQGCQSGQGFLLSRPIDRETAEQFLQSGANVFRDNPALVFRDPTSVIHVAEIQ